MNKPYNSEPKIALVNFPDQPIGLLEKIMERIVREPWTKIIVQWKGVTITMPKLNDLKGKVFKKLTVIKRVENKGEKVAWLCECECGNNLIVESRALTSDRISDCGCVERNRIEVINNEYCIGYTDKNEEFYFDYEDFDKIKRYTWCITPDGYVTTNDKRKTKLMHRLIMDAKKNQVVDHIYHNRNDNRKSQLRICTTQENQRNRKISKNNTSGATGVYAVKNGRWIATIRHN